MGRLLWLESIGMLVFRQFCQITALTLDWFISLEISFTGVSSTEPLGNSGFSEMLNKSIENS